MDEFCLTCLEVYREARRLMSKVPARALRYPMVAANKALNFTARHENPPADATHGKSLCRD